jgi:hypothetical protein
MVIRDTTPQEIKRLLEEKLYPAGGRISPMAEDKLLKIHARTGRYGIDSRATGTIDMSYGKMLDHLGLEAGEGITTAELDIHAFLDERSPDFFSGYALKVKYGRSKAPLPYVITIYLEDQDGHIHDWVSFSFSPRGGKNTSIDYHHTLGRIHKGDSEYYIRRLKKYENEVGRVLSKIIGGEVGFEFPKVTEHVPGEL